MPRSILCLTLLSLLACQPRTVDLEGVSAADGDDGANSAQDARLDALEAQVADLSSTLSDLESVVAEDRQTIYSLEATLNYALDDIAALEEALGSGGSSGGDTGASDAETIDALVEAVADLQDNEPAAWSTTGTTASESTSWVTLASDRLTITGDGPVLAWCSAAYSGSSGQLKLVLYTETSSSSTTAITGSSVAGMFNPSPGTWTLACEGLGGPWSISTLVAVQVPANGG